MKLKEFMDGLLKIENEYKLLASYIPIPRELEETESSNFADIAYDISFNPTPSEYTQLFGLLSSGDDVIKNNAQFIEFLKKEHPDSFELALKYHKNLAKYGYRNWSDFVEENWGTSKQDFHTKLIKQSPNRLRFKFESAGNPPYEGLDHIANMFPELTFDLSFSEPGMGLRGVLRWQDGGMLLEEEGAN